MRRKYQQRCRKFLQLVAMFNNHLRIQVTKNRGLAMPASKHSWAAPEASSPTARRLSRWAAASISSPRAGCRGLGVGDDVLAGARPLRSRSRTEEGAAAGAHALSVLPSLRMLPALSAVRSSQRCARSCLAAGALRGELRRRVLGGGAVVRRSAALPDARGEADTGSAGGAKTAKLHEHTTKMPFGRGGIGKRRSAHRKE